MAKLLYVTCDLKPLDHSLSLIAGDEFLNEYLKWNPSDEIHMLDLYRDNIQRFDADVLSALEKIRNGHHFAVLNPDEQRKLTRIWRLADQFVAADKSVFATNMWNLGFPAELKMYMDTVCVVGKTYRYTARGAEGLLKNRGKKCLLIYSADFHDFGGKEAPSVSYLRSVMEFMGIDELKTIVINGADSMVENARVSLAEATNNLAELAVSF